MLALAINASPRRLGETERLLNLVLDTLKECDWQTTMVQIGGEHLSKCRMCRQCALTRDNRCSITHDRFNSIYSQMLECDAMILGSPTLFSDVTVEMKALLERTNAMSQSNERPLMAKIGAAVVPLRPGRSIHTYAFDTINHMFHMSSMIIPGSLYRDKGAWYEKSEGHISREVQRDMRQLGEAIDWLGKLVHGNQDNYPAYYLSQ